MIVNGPVGELVGAAVLLPPHMADIVGGETGQKPLDLLEKRLQVRVLYPVDTKDLLDDKLRIKVDFQPAAAKLTATLQPKEQGPVFRLIVGATPKILPGGDKLVAAVVEYGDTGTGFTGVPP